MKNHAGKEMTEKEIIEEALNLMADVCCLLFETETDQGKAAAFMSDSLIKYLQVIHKDGDVLLAASDFASFEQKTLMDNLISKL